MKEFLQLDPVGIGSGCQLPGRQFQPLWKPQRLEKTHRAVLWALLALPTSPGGCLGWGDCHGTGLAGGFWGAVSAGGENRPGTQPALLVSHFYRQQIHPHPPWKEKLFGNKTCTWHRDPDMFSWCISLHPMALAGQAAVPRGPQLNCDCPHHPVPARHSSSSSQILGYVRGVEVAVPCLSL